MYTKGRTDNKTKEVLELTRMTKKGIQALCKKNKLYQTPELNDVLYLHYQGYRDIECLEEYTGLKCLWLENNAISEIGGLDNQKLLKCLFLNNNLIKKIENLENCPELDTLNLANNHITRIENCGIDKLPVLTTLILSHNYIRNAEQLGDVVNCKMLSVLDLAHNRIEDILVVKVFAQMPELRVLDLDGNPVVNKIPQYRKTLILECKNLTHLDRRPVFPRDRACAEAWRRGGYEEERREHNRWNKAERRKIRESVNATLRLRNRGGGDPQTDLIPSSSDEDDTERSSAPTSEPPVKQQPADSLSIDEDVQYVEYCDPESLPQPEGYREMQKCKICGRVECNYVHVEERPGIQKVLEAPEEILAKSQAVIAGNEMGGTEPKRSEEESNIVNIPNIFSVRYESENEDDQNSTVKHEVSTIQNQEAVEQTGNTGNINKDDLYEKAYVNYLDTVDRLLYIESKIEAVKTALSEETKDVLPSEENIVATSLRETTKANARQQIKTETFSNQEFTMRHESLESQEPSKIPNTEDGQKPFSEHHEPASLKCVVSESNIIIKDSAKSMLGTTPAKPVPPPSEKKKVRIMIEVETPEKHAKIPTTPIPNRKGRKIDYTRPQDATKRTKLDRGSCEEDMVDIFSDWVENLTELEPASLKLQSFNLLSSTTNDSALNFYSSPDDIIQYFKHEEEIPQLDLVDDKLSDNSEQIPKNVSKVTASYHEDTTSRHSSEDSQKEFDDEPSHTTGNAEKTITSIRDFVSSYDAFLHSIEGRLHDISERCKVSCVPPEYRTVEASKQGVNQDSLAANPEPIINEQENRDNLLQREDESQIVDTEEQAKDLCATGKIRTDNLEDPNNQTGTQGTLVGLLEQRNEIPLGSSSASKECYEDIKEILESKPDEIDSEIKPSGNNANITCSEGSEKAEDTNNHKPYINDTPIEENDCNTMQHVVHTVLDSLKNKEPTYLPELVSTDEKLHGYYTEVGRRNSEIIQRLLDSPLTKKMSAEEICKDLQETTEEIHRLNREKQKHRVENAKETVEVVYSHKDNYDGELEVIDNKLVIIHKNSSEVKDTATKDTFTRNEEVVETLFSTVKSIDFKEEGACKPDSSSESWDELIDDLTELSVWDERTTELQNRVEFKQGRGSKSYQYIDCEESFKGAYSFEDNFENIADKIPKICDQTSECIRIQNVQEATSEERYFQNSLGLTNDITGQPISSITKYEKNHFESSLISSNSEQLVESPCSGIIQHEDSSEVYQEALSSYVISETSDGLEIFEPAQCEINSPSSDINSKPRASPCELRVCETENVWFDSTSSCDVLLGTTFESTLSSSCWDAEDEQTSNGGLDNENFEEQVGEINNAKRQNESTEATLSDQEDNESHPVNFCFTSQGGRYTI